MFLIPGITPKITNEVGLYADTTATDLHSVPRHAVHRAQFSKLHRVRNATEQNGTVQLSLPNDRAASIRPSNRHEKYQ